MKLPHDGAVFSAIAEKMNFDQTLLASLIETVESDCISYSASSDVIAVLDAFLWNSGIIAEKDANSLRIRL